MEHENDNKRELRFVCPECGSEGTLCAHYQSWIEVEHVYEGGAYEGDTFDNDIVTFSCGECGYVLTNENGNKVYEDGLAEWLTRNCPQACQDQTED